MWVEGDMDPLILLSVNVLFITYFIPQSICQIKPNLGNISFRFRLMPLVFNLDINLPDTLKIHPTICWTSFPQVFYIKIFQVWKFLFICCPLSFIAVCPYDCHLCGRLSCFHYVLLFTLFFTLYLYLIKTLVTGLFVNPSLLAEQTTFICTPNCL